ncbi:MAG: hypothetical protein ACJ79A_05640 [Gemmatimonadaceae bacterium]
MIFLAQLTAAESSSALARLAEPWNALYSDSKAVSSTVVFLHLVPLLLAGGAAITADRATLRAARGSAEDRVRQLRDLARVHVVVLGGLALSFASGVLLFLSDVDEFLGSPVFWVKLGFVGLLLLNGFMMTRTEKALGSGGNETVLWGRLRTISVLSLILWTATTLVGVVLTNYA